MSIKKNLFYIFLVLEKGQWGTFYSIFNLFNMIESYLSILIEKKRKWDTNIINYFILL